MKSFELKLISRDANGDPENPAKPWLIRFGIKAGAVIAATNQTVFFFQCESSNPKVDALSFCMQSGHAGDFFHYIEDVIYTKIPTDPVPPQPLPFPLCEEDGVTTGKTLAVLIDFKPVKPTSAGTTLVDLMSFTLTSSDKHSFAFRLTNSDYSSLYGFFDYMFYSA
jgi:hypothetical protein